MIISATLLVVILIQVIVIDEQTIKHPAALLALVIELLAEQDVIQRLFYTLVGIGVEHITGIAEFLHDLRTIQSRVAASLGITKQVSRLLRKNVLRIAALPVIDVAHDNNRRVGVFHRQVQDHAHRRRFRRAANRGDGSAQCSVMMP